MPQEQPNQSNAERDAINVLANILTDNPLRDPSDQVLEEHQGIYRTDSAAAKSLHCIALIRDGKIMPYVDLEKVPEPRTGGERMHYMTFIARTILDGLMDALLFWEERRRQERNQAQHREEHEDDEGGTCHV